MRITDPANRSSDMKRVIAILTFLLSLIVSLHADNPQSADDFIPAISFEKNNINFDLVDKAEGELSAAIPTSAAHQRPSSLIHRNGSPITNRKS